MHFCTTFASFHFIHTQQQKVVPWRRNGKIETVFLMSAFTVENYHGDVKSIESDLISFLNTISSKESVHLNFLLVIAILTTTLTK